MQSSPQSQQPISPGTDSTVGVQGAVPSPVIETTPIQPSHPMVTRGKAGIFKPKAWLINTKTDWTKTGPTKVRDALATPQWRAAMNSEYTALIRNRTWTLVPFSQSLNVIGNKWIFKIKKNPDGSVQRYKVRLVAKGFHQNPGIDYFETFSPVVKASTVRIILSIVVHRGWKLRQLDFNNAFLNGSLDENVYMVQPPGYVDKQYPTHVCKLNRAIYGLKQVPRAWNTTLKNALLSWGFVNARSGSSLFVYRSGSDVILLLVYVDDVIITGSSPHLIDNLIATLDKQFALKDLGLLSYFLGI